MHGFDRHFAVRTRHDIGKPIGAWPALASGDGLRPAPASDGNQLRKPAIAQLSRNPERFQIHHHEQNVTQFVTMSTAF
jgi:hypothetical protein